MTYKFNPHPKAKDLGPVIHRLKVRIAAENNKALTAWEHEIKLHIRTKPGWCPEFLWKRIVKFVVLESAQVNTAPSYLK